MNRSAMLVFSMVAIIFSILGCKPRQSESNVAGVLGGLKNSFKIYWTTDDKEQSSELLCSLYCTKEMPTTFENQSDALTLCLGNESDIRRVRSVAVNDIDATMLDKEMLAVLRDRSNVLNGTAELERTLESFFASSLQSDKRPSSQTNETSNQTCLNNVRSAIVTHGQDQPRSVSELEKASSTVSLFSKIQTRAHKSLWEGKLVGWQWVELSDKEVDAVKEFSPEFAKDHQKYQNKNPDKLSLFYQKKGPQGFTRKKTPEDMAAPVDQKIESFGHYRLKTSEVYQHMGTGNGIRRLGNEYVFAEDGTYLGSFQVFFGYVGDDDRRKPNPGKIPEKGTIPK